MSDVQNQPLLGGEHYSEPEASGPGVGRTLSRWMMPLEAVSAALTLGIIGLLLAAVLSRYVFANSIVWIDEVVSISFIWVTMIGAALAMHRNEHLRLSLVVDKLPSRM